MGNIKADQKKLAWHLMPPDALEEIVKVMQHGAEKYEPRDWETGTNWHRYFSAAMRHLWAWWKGEDVDASGYSHLAHAAASVLILLTYELRKVGTDDRPGK